MKTAKEILQEYLLAKQAGLDPLPQPPFIAQPEEGGQINQEEGGFPIISSLLRGITGGPPIRAKSVGQYLAQTIPYSLGATARGIITFPYEAGKLIYEEAKKGVEEEGLKGALAGVGKGIWENIEGMLHFMGEPIGLFGLERLKERWYTDPVGSILAIVPYVKGLRAALKKVGKSPEAYAKSVVERVNQGETIAEAVRNEAIRVGVEPEQLPLIPEAKIETMPVAKSLKQSILERTEDTFIDAFGKQFLENLPEEIEKIPEKNRQSLLKALPKLTEKEVQEYAIELAKDPELVKKLKRMTSDPKENAARVGAAWIRSRIANRLALDFIKRAQDLINEGADPKSPSIADLIYKAQVYTAEQAIYDYYYQRGGRIPAQQLVMHKFHKKDLEVAPPPIFEVSALAKGKAADMQRAFVIDRIEKLDRMFHKFSRKLPEEKYMDFIEGLMRLDPTRPQDLAAYLRSWAKPSFWDKIQSYFYNNILYGISTHVTNFIGNTLKGSIESFLVKPVATILDAPLSTILKKPRELTFKNLIAYYSGMIHGLEKGILKAIEVFKSGFDPEEFLSPGKWDVQTLPVWKSSVAQYTLELPTRALKAADVLFKGIWEEARKYELAVNKVDWKGKTLGQVLNEAAKLAENDPNIIDAASYWGKWMTFNEAPGRLTQLALRIRRQIPELTPIIPFIRIAGNLMRQGNIEYSPVGLVKASGPPELAARYARAALGTGLMALGYIWYKAGRITLAPPKTAGEKARFYDVEKKQAYSLKIGDKWFPIRPIEPFCYPFLIGAMIGKAIEEDKMNEKSAEKVIISAAGEVGRMLLNASYLSSFSNLIEGFGGYRDPTDVFQNAVENILGGLIPASALLRNITYALDPEIKEARVSIPEALAANIPGLSEKVPARLTIFGESVERPGGRLKAILRSAPSIEPKDFLSEELSRLQINTTFPSKKVLGLELNDEGYRLLKQIAGKRTKEFLQRLVSSPQYQNLPDNMRIRLIEYAINKAREVARFEFLSRTKLSGLSKYIKSGQLSSAFELLRE